VTHTLQDVINLLYIQFSSANKGFAASLLKCPNALSYGDTRDGFSSLSNQQTASVYKKVNKF
jgi:hypothetical protein